jgi:capsular polysaccharide biosynthesis protein/Mrp family chromosome partitioning ATPase
MKVYVDAEDDAALPERHFRADCPALLGRPVEERDSGDARPTRRCQAGCWARYQRGHGTSGAGLTGSTAVRDAIVRPVKRQKWFFAGVVAVLLLIALFAVFQRNRLYQSQATVSVYPRKGVPLFSGYQDYSSVVLGTYAQLLQSRNFLAGISHDLSSHPSPDSIKGHVNVAPVSGTTVLNLTAHASSAAFASELAEVSAKHLGTAIDRSPQFQAFITQTATPSRRALGPSRLWLIVGSIAGALLLGFVAVVVRDRVSGFLRGPNEVAAAVGAPVWGAIPDAPALGRRDVLMAEREDTMEVAGAFESLASNLLSVDNPSDLRVVAVAGLDGDARAVAAVAANLGWALSELGETATLVDVNVVQPRMHTLLGTDIGEGFSELGLAPDDDAAPTPIATHYDGLTVIPAGAAAVGAAGRRRALARILGWQRERSAGWCILCMGRLDADGAASLLSQRIDALTLVVSASRSREAVVADMCTRVRALGVGRVGLVVTAVPGRVARSWSVGFVDPPPMLTAPQPALSDDGFRADG